MKKIKIENIAQFVLECAKWGLVLYLLLPLRKAMSEPVNFTRIVFGILLFILFSGKMFYDAIMKKRKGQKERSAVVDLLSTAAMAVAVSLVVGLVIISIGMMIFSIMQESTKPQ